MDLQTLYLDELDERVGQVIHVSDWTSVQQEEVDQFGRVTRDIDRMHMDPEWARDRGPFGTTILYGFLTLSLLPSLCSQVQFRDKLGENGYDINYGFNRIRFVEPIPVGAKFRNSMVLKQVEHRPDGAILVTTENTIQLEGSDRPALIAEWLGMLVRDL